MEDGLLDVITVATTGTCAAKSNAAAAASTIRHG